jgi:toxin ParE1/3/4
MSYRILPLAETDIEGIVLYIAEDNPAAARKWLNDIHVRCRHISEMPRMGTSRPDIRPDLRMSPIGNYLVLYRPVGPDVEIVRVIHGARQWQELL